MKQIVCVLWIAATLGAPDLATVAPQASVPAAPASASSLGQRGSPSNRKPMVAQRLQAEQSAAPSAWPAYLTVGQEEAIRRRAFEATFNVDHSP